MTTLLKITLLINIYLLFITTISHSYIHPKLPSLKSFKSIKFTPIFNTNTDTNNDNNNSSDSEKRPPIIPFDSNDFKRDDIKLPPKETYVYRPDKLPTITPKKPSQSRSTYNEGQNYDPNDDNMRPTSYDQNIIDPDDIDEVPPYTTDSDNTTNSNDNVIIKFLKDSYITQPYDSKNKKQAKYVVRSITLISFLIG